MNAAPLGALFQEEGRQEVSLGRSRFLIACSLLVMAALDAMALETKLTWKVGKEEVTFSESIVFLEGRISATIVSSVGEHDSIVMDGNRSTLEWRRRVDAEKTDITAIRNGAMVRIRGVYKGKPYDKALDFGSLPWYEFQEISYESFFATGAESGSFWTIDRKTLAPSRFLAERDGPETIIIMGGPVKAIRYGLSVNGVPHFIFKAHFWIRENDGRFLRLDVPPVFTLPRSVVELTGES
jgi:hypothetical protein